MSNGSVMELVDREDLKSSASGRVGANPTAATIIERLNMAKNKSKTGQCHYCGVTVSKDPYSPIKGTLDHKFPKGKGGTSHPLNIVLACRSCNYDKGSMSYAEFTAILAARKERRF